MDSVYETAVNRALELQEELKNLNDFIEMYRRTRHRLGLDSIAQNENLESPTKEPKSSIDAAEEPQRRQRVTDNPRPAHVAQAARAILLENKQPMTRRELHAALAKRGVVVRGADPVKTLGTMLWRAEAFDQVEGLGYWPRGVPLPGSQPASDPFDALL